MDCRTFREEECWGVLTDHIGTRCVDYELLPLAFFFCDFSERSEGFSFPLVGSGGQACRLSIS